MSSSTATMYVFSQVALAIAIYHRKKSEQRKKDLEAEASVMSEEPTAAHHVVTETELAYIAGNNSIRTLVVLSHGLKKDDGSDLIDIKNEEPWKSIPRIEIKPTLHMLKAEIKRRHRAFGLPKSEPRPAAWRSSKISKWLYDHPIENEADLDFLKQTIANCRQQISREARVRRQLERDVPPPAVVTTDGGESVPSVITTAGNVESTLENIAVLLGNFVKEDRERRLEEIKEDRERRLENRERRLEEIKEDRERRLEDRKRRLEDRESRLEDIKEDRKRRLEDRKRRLEDIKEDRKRRLEEIKEDRERRLEERMDAISAEKRKVRRLLIESRQAGNDELHECYKQELNELDSNERRIQEILETL
ncbi:hypothetical protein IV203_017298 [Nitzschia inconspicua]|uniref:Uncharacterized protein n=1 Tax=Nitzschia inconspicua TaxID=303405 RepID=A0A9K3KRE4_9STRA|nr:hypothetical protein IV203_017298 [Nitzschia inconspicua]